MKADNSNHACSPSLLIQTGLILLFAGATMSAAQQDDDVAAQLRALGYIGGGFQDRVRPEDILSEIFQPQVEPAQRIVDVEIGRRPVADLLHVPDSPLSTSLATIHGETRHAVTLQPGDRLSWQVMPVKGDLLLIGIGRIYEQVAPTSVLVQWDLIVDGEPVDQRVCFPTPGTWIDQELPLGEWTGQKVLLNLSIKSIDPEDANPEILLAPLLLTHSQTEWDHPNVVLVIIDTLRADALSCYGQPERTSPFIDILGSQGVLFDNVIAQAPHTEPSIPSILTGLYPHKHGRMLREGRHNADDPEYVGSPNLPENYETLCEYLQNEGYYTAGVYNNVVLSERFGFARGLYRYIDHAESAGLDDPWKRIAVPTAALGIDETIRILDKVPDGVPFHLFVHILDPHYPYTPPDEWNGRIRRSEDTIDHDTYLSEVLYVDAQIGRLCRALRDRKMWDDTLLVIASDHGEEFTNPQDRPIGHGRTLFQTQLQVPLIFFWPAGIEGDRRVFQMVETVDVLPTILELTGIQPKHDLSGQSLASLIQGKPGTYKKRYAYAEAIRRGEERKAILSGEYKLVYFTDSSRRMLYHLNRDPNEEKNIAKENPEIVAKLWEKMNEQFDLPPLPKAVDISVPGQDGQDIVHSFSQEEAYKPGIEDLHLRAVGISADVNTVKIWADDHLQGNRAHRLGWRAPPQGEMPAYFERDSVGCDIYFDPDSELVGRDVFVRLECDDKTAFIGRFRCPSLSLDPKRNLDTRDRVIAHWKFDSPEEIERWTMGRGGRVQLESDTTGGAMRVETSLGAGLFRMLHPVRDLPADGRILIDFVLRVDSGGLRVEVVDPARNALLARSDFLTEGPDDETVANVARGEDSLVGLSFQSHGEQQVLVILSNRGASKTSFLIDDFRVSESRSPK